METRPRRHWSPVLVPLAVGAVFALLGHPLRAGVVAAFAVLAAILILVGVPVSTWVERGAAKLGHFLTAAAGVVVFLVIIGPAWTWGRITRRDALARPETGWADHPLAPATPASLGSPNPLTVGRRSLAGRLTWAVGCVVVLLGLNYAAGWVVDQASDNPGPESMLPTVGVPTTVPGAPDESPSTTVPPAPRTAVDYDPRIETPAMRGYPWAEEYLADIQRTPTNYWPYTQYRPLPFTSPYVNIDGWSRRSYRTAGSAEGRPVVWLFGGSTTWGEGQRDEGTIASWLARLAEEDGMPLEISNFGQRGWTHFQEMVLYEQQLALVGPPDLALFYDGVNEINTQSLVDEAVPSHYDVTEQREEKDGKTVATRFGAAAPSDTLAEDLWFAYSEHSMIHKVARWFSSPAGAAPEAPDRPITSAKPTRTADEYDVTLQDGIDAGKVYERGKQLTLSLSDQYEVPTLLYWQPFKFKNDDERAATDQITSPTIDLSELLLDHQDVYIDGAHTNEEGARIVAERIWKDLEPQIRDWYADNG